MYENSSIVSDFVAVANKLAFQERTGLNVDPDAPIFFWPSRLDPVQKGCQLVAEVLYDIVNKYWADGLRVVFVSGYAEDSFRRNLIEHDFTFLPNCRSRDYKDSPIVKEFLAGDMSHAQTFARGAGTLTIFRGEFSLHGVTEVGGAHPRVTAIFTYDEMPGRVASDEVNIRIYGERAKRIIEARETV